MRNIEKTVEQHQQSINDVAYGIFQGLQPLPEGKYWCDSFRPDVTAEWDALTAEEREVYVRCSKVVHYYQYAGHIVESASRWIWSAQHQVSATEFAGIDHETRLRYWRAALIAMLLLDEPWRWMHSRYDGYPMERPSEYPEDSYTA